METEVVECGLHARFWTFHVSTADRARQLALILDGSAEATADQQRFAVAGPALIWIGRSQSGRLRMDAGATGFRVQIEDALLVSAIGDDTESPELRHLADRDFALSLAGQDEAVGIMERCLGGVLRELSQPQPGSTLVLSALMRIVLVALLRASGGTLHHSGTGERIGLLQRFRQLVEMNFRSHWTVAQYAAALGISADRLHAICTQGVGKSPKALISERLATEAMLRLERSSLTIQQLGHSLGFSDPAHFSSFFRRMTGTPPARYRRAVMDARRSHTPPPAPGFAEWP